MKYQNKEKRYEIIYESSIEDLENWLRGILSKNNLTGLEKEILENLPEELKAAESSSLDHYVQQYFRILKILSRLSRPVPAELSRTRVIGYDDFELRNRSQISIGSENIRYAPQQFLKNLAGVTSGRVLGAYDRSTDTIYILDTLRGIDHDEVLFHERYHRENPHASERAVREATAKTGYNKFQGVNLN